MDVGVLGFFVGGGSQNSIKSVANERSQLLASEWSHFLIFQKKLLDPNFFFSNFFFFHSHHVSILQKYDALIVRLVEFVVYQLMDIDRLHVWRRGRGRKSRTQKGSKAKTL